MTLTELLQRPSSRGYTPLGEDYELCQVGLNPHDRSDLHSRINLRFEQMLQNGFIEEVEQLRDKYPLTLAHASMRCVGYRQVWQHLEGEFDREELILRGQAATRQLAKRQLTWMRKWPNLNALAAPYSPSKVSSKLDLVEVTLNCLNSQLC